MKFLGLEITRAKKKRLNDPNRALLNLIRRNYAGGEESRLLADWKTSDASADADLFPQLAVMRNRARHLAKNNDYAKRFLALLKANVVGPNGVILQARAKNNRGVLDKADNDYIETSWKRWGRAGFCTMDGRYSFVDCQNTIVEHLARDGEVLYRYLSGVDVNPYRFAIEFIEIDRLDHRLNGTAKSGNLIRMGVELNRYRRPVAYYLLPEDKNNSLYVGSISYNAGADHIRIPAADIRHIYLPQRINQTRGVTWFHTAMRRLQLLNGYEESEVVAARVAAAKMGFFKSATGEEFRGDPDLNETTADGRTIPVMNAEPGTFEELPDGVDFVGWNPDHPVAAYEAFVLAVLRGVASGLGVSYVSLANDLRGVSYSSIRQGVLEERDFYKAIQRFLVDHFVAETYERWIQTAISVGALNFPIAKLSKFLNVVWRPRGWQWVDPLKETEANKRAVENGFKSIQDVCGENGKDAAEVFNQLNDEIKLADSVGINVPLLQTLKGGSNGDQTEDHKNAAVIPYDRKRDAEN